MSQANIEIVRREYDALAARDWTAIAKLWHPEIELETDPSAPGAGTYRGHDEITKFFDTWAEPYSAYRVEPIGDNRCRRPDRWPTETLRREGP